MHGAPPKPPSLGMWLLLGLCMFILAASQIDADLAFVAVIAVMLCGLIAALSVAGWLLYWVAHGIGYLAGFVSGHIEASLQRDTD